MQFKNVNRTTKIRILFVIEYMYEFAGTEKHLFQLIRDLNEKQFKCYLLALAGSVEMLNKFAGVGAEILPWRLKRLYSLKTINILQKLKVFVLREKIDFIQSYNAVADLVAALLVKITKRPMHIVNLRDLGSYRKRRYNVLMRIVNSRRKEYIAVCRAIAKHCTMLSVHSYSDIKIIHNGIEFSFSRNYYNHAVKTWRLSHNIPDNAFVVGNISQFRPEKGHEVFFKAIELVRSEIPEIVALAIGGGPLLSTYQKQYRVQIASGKIMITGFLDNVHPALANMDIFCFTPVSNEGFSNAILEAMALGKPVIATDVGGNSEAVVHGATGYVVPAGEPDKVATAILDLYHAPEKGQAMGQAGKVRVEQHFSLEKIIQQYEKFYFEKITEVNGVN